MSFGSHPLGRQLPDGIRNIHPEMRDRTGFIRSSHVVSLGFTVRVVAVECAVPVALLRYVVRVIALACIDRVAILWCVHLMILETPITVR
jgi:hypothetical protein